MISQPPEYDGDSLAGASGTALHQKYIVGAKSHGVEIVIPFFPFRRLHFSKSAGHGGRWNLALADPLIISSHGLWQRSLEEVRNDAKASGPRWFDISRTVAQQGIGVVNHKGLFRLKTRGKQSLFPPARAQHVQANPNVSLKKTLAIERCLPRTLNPDQEHSFHQDIMTLREVC
jgi:hypothetical protein